MSAPIRAGLIRQGDVLLIPRVAAPSRAVPCPKDDGRIILAYGEVTGHAHAIEGGGIATLYDLPDATDGRRALFVDGTARLVHEEHAPAVLAGWYDVTVQSEYTPAAIQNVLD